MHYSITSIVKNSYQLSVFSYQQKYTDNLQLLTDNSNLFCGFPALDLKGV